MKQALVFLVLLVLLLMPVPALAVPDHVEYLVTVNADCSATWKIIQVTDINSTADNLDEFIQRLLLTINAAKENASRDMALDMNSIAIKTEVHWETSSQTIEYDFRWENFSTVETGKIVVGDVFNYAFPEFYGYGELFITYPQDYTPTSAFPSPNERNISTETLHWYRTQDFSASKPIIVLSKIEPTTDLSQATLAFAGSGVVAAIAVSFLLLRQREQRKIRLQNVKPYPQKEMQDSKERILQLVKSSGGSIRQAEICIELKFSRAKTSILLTELERNNQIKRDKKGKNKIVYALK